MTSTEDLSDGSSLTRARRQVLAETVSLIKKAYKEQREWDSYMYFESVNERKILEEILWVDCQLSAPERAAIKRFQESERKAYAENN